MPRVEVRFESDEASQDVEVVRVLVDVGETVEAGQSLLEIATDKVDVEVEAPSAGQVIEIFVADGEIVAPPNRPLLVLEV